MARPSSPCWRFRSNIFLCHERRCTSLGSCKHSHRMWSVVVQFWHRTRCCCHRWSSWWWTAAISWSNSRSTCARRSLDAWSLSDSRDTCRALSKCCEWRLKLSVRWCHFRWSNFVARTIASRYVVHCRSSEPSCPSHVAKIEFQTNWNDDWVPHRWCCWRHQRFDGHVLEPLAFEHVGSVWEHEVLLLAVSSSCGPTRLRVVARVEHESFVSAGFVAAGSRCCHECDDCCRAKNCEQKTTSKYFNV